MCEEKENILKVLYSSLGIQVGESRCFIQSENYNLEIIQHFSVKMCLCPVQFQGIQWYLLMSWHIRALSTLFLPPYFPINLNYASYVRSPVEKWPSSVNFVGKTLVPFIINQDSF